jgi:hypothetical protein
MRFVDALRQKDMLTENGMATNSTSLDACVDLFFNIGAMRGQDKQRLIATFSKAFIEDSKRAMKLLFWARDVRGGAGERQVFKDILVYLAENHDLALKPNLHLISEYGRFDDLLSLSGTCLEKEAFKLIADALTAQNGLCAKWMPRKGQTAEKLRAFLKFSPKQYRKTLVNLTNVVETKMCAKEWDSIEFGKLPSVASARYQKAFGKNAYESYSAYIQSLVKGEAKINAGAVYPYDVTKSLNHGNSTVANEQWKALPNYMEGANDMILPVVDVSGSMSSPAGGSKTVTCMDVAISLGLYISERNEGPFKDAFITFSSKPQLQVLSGSLKDRYAQMSRSDWGMSTNLEATFKLILDQATKHKLSQDEMPNKILILSDMEFNAAMGGGGWKNEPGSWNPTAQQMIEKMYTDAGYKMPQIVYWNIQSRNGGVPVAFDTLGTALVSGFSPAIMKSLLGGDIESPKQIMDKTIMSERYAPVV